MQGPLYLTELGRAPWRVRGATSTFTSSVPSRYASVPMAGKATGEGASGEASGECDRFGPGDTGVHEREVDLQTVVVRTSSGFNATETSFKRGTNLPGGRGASEGARPRDDTGATSTGEARAQGEPSVRGASEGARPKNGTGAASTGSVRCGGSQ